MRYFRNLTGDTLHVSQLGHEAVVAPRHELAVDPADDPGGLIADGLAAVEGVWSEVHRRLAARKPGKPDPTEQSDATPAKPATEKEQ